MKPTTRQLLTSFQYPGLGLIPAGGATPRTFTVLYRFTATDGISRTNSEISPLVNGGKSAHALRRRLLNLKPANNFRLAASIMLSLLLLTPAWAVERQLLTGHIPSATARLQAVGRLPGSSRLNLAIGLPLRNQEGLTTLLDQLYDPASPQYRHYLSPEQFAEKFGPAKE